MEILYRGFIIHVFFRVRMLRGHVLSSIVVVVNSGERQSRLTFLRVYPFVIHSVLFQ